MTETNGSDAMTPSDSNILARIDERTQAQTVAFALHVKDDAEKFDKVFSFITKRFDKIDERFDKVDLKFEATNKKIDDGISSTNSKVEPLQNESNQRKGAISAGKVMSSCFYAGIALVAGYFGGSHK